MSDHCEELLGAYALHALDPEEQRAVEEHLAGCPRCRAEAEAHEQVATLLGNSGGDAPADIWMAISQELDGAPPPIDLAIRRRRIGQGRPRNVVLAVIGVAAAVLLTVGLLGAQSVRQSHRIDHLQSTLAEAQADGSVAAALAAPGARQARLTSTDGTTRVPVVILPTGSAYLVGSSLPALTSDETYQLWGQTSGTTYVSLGTLGSRPRTERFHVEDGTSALAITVERRPGAVAPTNAPRVAGTLQ